MSVTVPTTTELTIDDLLALDPDGPAYELVDGQLEEIHVSNLASAVGSNAIGILHVYTKATRAGQVFEAHTCYQCFPWMPRNARKPDVSFIALEHLPEDWAALGFFTIAPDLAAEVLSPNDLAYKVNAKIEEYRRAGVRLIWVIDPEQRTVIVHRPDGSANTLQESDDLTGEDVLPGFRCRVADLFPPRVEPPTP